MADFKTHLIGGVSTSSFATGYFFNSDEDYAEETSLTEEGAMVNPEFLVKFINVIKN